jgi:hypothetical protein
MVKVTIMLLPSLTSVKADTLMNVAAVFELFVPRCWTLVIQA